MNETDLKLLLEAFWFAPQDAFLRARERAIWQKHRFSRPTLDIGCSDGRIGKLLFEGKKIDLGIDVDARLIGQAKACGVYRFVAVMDAQSLALKSGSFTTTIANSTFEHITDDLAAVKEIARVTKKGGTIFLTVPTRKLQTALRTLIRDDRRWKQFNRRVRHLHYRSKAEWIKILQGAGLSLVGVQYYFPKRAVVAWYRLYRIATFRPYRRELWSYIKDSPYGKTVPSSLVKRLLFEYLKRFLNMKSGGNGLWLYLRATKKEDAKD